MATYRPGQEGPSYAPPQLPEGWIPQWDANSKKYYFVQLSTGASQWETPTQYVSFYFHNTPVCSLKENSSAGRSERRRWREGTEKDYADKRTALRQLDQRLKQHPKASIIHTARLAQKGLERGELRAKMGIAAWEEIWASWP